MFFSSAIIDLVSQLPEAIREEFLNALTAQEKAPVESAVSLRRVIEIFVWTISQKTDDPLACYNDPAARCMKSDWFKAIVPKSTCSCLLDALNCLNQCIHYSEDDRRIKTPESLLLQQSMENLLTALKWLAGWQKKTADNPKTKKMRLISFDHRGGNWAEELTFYFRGVHQIVSSLRGMNRSVVIGAPHHARIGIDLICKPPRVADSGTACLAARLASDAKALLIAACMPMSKDPNKKDAAKDEYQHLIFTQSPKLVIEIHGMAEESSPFDIEISGGVNEYSKPVDFGQAVLSRIKYLIRNLTPRDSMDERVFHLLSKVAIGMQKKDPIKKEGMSNHVLFRCAQLHVPSYQIEFKPDFRIGKINMDQLPRLGQHIAQCLAMALYDIHSSCFVTPLDLPARRPEAPASIHQAEIIKELNTITGIPSHILNEFKRSVGNLGYRPAIAAVAVRKGLEYVLWDIADLTSNKHLTSQKTLHELMQSQWFRETIPTDHYRKLRAVRSITNNTIHAMLLTSSDPDADKWYKIKDKYVNQMESAYMKLIPALRWYGPWRAGKTPSVQRSSIQVCRVDSQGGSWSQELKHLLINSNLLIISRRGKSDKCMIAAPRHICGIQRSDQKDSMNYLEPCTGLLAARIAQELGAIFIAACPSSDSSENRILQSLYDQELLMARSSLIIEVRGSIPGQTNKDIIMSSPIKDTRLDDFCSKLEKVLNTRDTWGPIRDNLDEWALSKLSQTKVKRIKVDADHLKEMNSSFSEKISDSAVMLRFHFGPIFRTGRRNPDVLPRIGQRFAQAFSMCLYHHFSDAFDALPKFILELQNDKEKNDDT